MVLLHSQADKRKRWTKIAGHPKQRNENELAHEFASVPSSIFMDRNLAPLESIAEYLKEEKGLTYHEIALLVGRDDRTIWTCYNRARKKREVTPKEEVPAELVVQIPLEMFRNRALAPLESITAHLKERAGLSFHEIAMLLNRDDRTIWTCYNRVQKKLIPN